MALLLCGCAYTLGPTNGQIAGAKSVQVNPFANNALEPRLIADCLESFGGLAAARGEPVRAAFLFGAADELRRSITAVRPPDQDPWYEHYLGLARGETAADEFDAEYERGRQAPLEQAIETALG